MLLAFRLHTTPQGCHATQQNPTSSPDGHSSRARGYAAVASSRHPSMDSSLLFGSNPTLPGARSPASPFPTFASPPAIQAKSPLEDVLRLVPPGSDEYVTERYAFEIQPLLKQWSHRSQEPPPATIHLWRNSSMPRSRPPFPSPQGKPRSAPEPGSKSSRENFAQGIVRGDKRFVQQLHDLARAALPHRSRGISRSPASKKPPQTAYRSARNPLRHRRRPNDKKA